jgi:hypothetical protein
MSKFKPPKFVGRRRLRAMLRRCGCTSHDNRGAGSHWLVKRELADGIHSFPLPLHRDYGPSYLDPLRRRLRLTAEDGVPDAEFYRNK